MHSLKEWNLFVSVSIKREQRVVERARNGQLVDLPMPV